LANYLQSKRGCRPASSDLSSKAADLSTGRPEALAPYFAHAKYRSGGSGHLLSVFGYLSAEGLGGEGRPPLPFRVNVVMGDLPAVPMTTERTQLVLLGGEALFRETLCRLLEAEPDLAVSAQCGSESEALSVLARLPVDVVLLDLDTGSDEGYRFLSSCRAAGYKGKVLVVTQGLSAEVSLKALQLGVSGIFIKSRGLPGLLKAIRMVAGGDVCLEQEMIQLLASGELRVLAGRDQQVLRGVLDGLTNRKIAERLGLPEGAVKVAMRRLFQKARVRTRAQLTRVALEGSLGPTLR
jgi:two-component system nitrate/nitrite response regulator NarL